MSYSYLLGLYTELYTGGCCIESKTREGIEQEMKIIMQDDDIEQHADFITLLVNYYNDETKKEKKKRNYDKRKNNEISKLKEENKKLKEFINQHKVTVVKLDE